MAGKTYDVLLRVIAQDLASPVLQGIGGALSNMATIAGGIALARVFEGAANAAMGFASAGLDAAAAMQQQQAGIKALMALEAQHNSIVTKSIVVGYTQAGLTKKQSKELETLTDRQERLSTQIPLLVAQTQEASQRVWEMTNRWTEQGLATQTAKARYADMQNRLAALNEQMAETTGRINELNGAQTKSVPITVRVASSEMAYSDALLKVNADALAQYQALRQLGFRRGVPTKDITQMFQYGLGVGFSTEEMQKFLPVATDWSVALGKEPAVLQRVVKAMGDVKSAGHLMAQEILQFKNANIPIVQLLADKFGITTEAVLAMTKAGDILADDVLVTLIDYMGKLTPAADELGKTLPVLQRGFAAIVTAGVAEFFLGSAEAIGRFLAPYRDLFTLSGDPFANLRKSGDGLGTWLSGILTTLKPLVDKLFGMFMGNQGAGGDTNAMIQGVIDQLTAQVPGSIDKIVDIFIGLVNDALVKVPEGIDALRAAAEKLSPIGNSIIGLFKAVMIEAQGNIPELVAGINLFVEEWLDAQQFAVSANMDIWSRQIADILVQGVLDAEHIAAEGARASSGVDWGSWFAKRVQSSFDIATAIGTLGGLITQAVAGGIALATGTLASRSDAMTTPFVDWFKKNLESVGIGIRNALVGQWSYLFGKPVGDALGAALQGAWNIAYGWLTPEIGKSAPKLSMDIANFLNSAIDEYITKGLPIAMNQMAVIGGNLIDGLIKGIQDKFSAIVDALEGAINAAMGAGAKIGEAVNRAINPQGNANFGQISPSPLNPPNLPYLPLPSVGASSMGSSSLTNNISVNAQGATNPEEVRSAARRGVIEALNAVTRGIQP